MPDKEHYHPSEVETALLAWINKFAPYGVVATDRNLRIQVWNKWMEQHSGKEQEDVQGSSLLELYPDLQERRLTGLFSRALEGEVSFLSTALHGYLIPLPPRTADSAFERMQQTARVGPLVLGKEVCGLIIVLEDVTQRESQAAILRRQHERDEILSWALGHLIKSDDPRTTIRDVFLKLAEHLDFDTYLLYLADAGADATLRMHAVGGVAPEDQEEIACLTESSGAWLAMPGSTESKVINDVAGRSGAELQTPRKLGLRAYISLPLHFGEDFLGILCFGTHSRDCIKDSEADLITTLSQYLAVALGREKTARELHLARENLEKKVTDRTAKLREIIAELETFSYTVAHDLRAPIRALVGYSDVLIEDFGENLPGEAHRVIDKLANSARRLDALTLDLLEFSKVSRQEVVLNRVNLDELLADILSYGIQQQAQVEVHHPLLPVLAQQTMLQQCLSNLVENGIKFVAPGKTPKIRIWTEKITSSVQSTAPASSPFSRSLYSLDGGDTERLSRSGVDRQRVRIWVEDEGIGISPEAQRRIFGIFERGPIGNEFPGTGIGLAIVTRAIERMGGTCGVESEEGVGSRFWLELRQA